MTIYSDSPVLNSIEPLVLYYLHLSFLYQHKSYHGQLQKSDELKTFKA